jgi:ADP-ribose pyrophosphatase
VKPREAWKRLRSERLGDFRVFTVRRDRIVSPRTRAEHDFYVLDGSDWINVIPVTRSGSIVLVEQYRHGTREVTLEIPGGAVDAADPDPMSAARRELREETGYEAPRWTDLGFVHPNPAIQSNRCYTYLALDCVRVAEPRLDAAEDIAVREATRREIREMLADGRIRHALVVAAFAKWSDF